MFTSELSLSLQTILLLSSHPHNSSDRKMRLVFHANPPTTHIPSISSHLSSTRIGKRWAEYQGSNNWDGLLDPLDPILRSEILRYGDFVQSTYTAIDFSSTTCRFPRNSLLTACGLPNTGYRVTRNLHATPNTRLPLFQCRSSWIGYVAICQDAAEITRLGRRDIVVALRGTVTLLEWIENLRAFLTNLPGPDQDSMVERGFWSLFTSHGPSQLSLRDKLREEVGRLLITHAGKDKPPVSVTLAGHSLGAALAILAADDITGVFEGMVVTVVSFGGPRVGNDSFRRRLEERGVKVLRVVNTRDVVTKVPGFGEAMVPSWLLSRVGWGYADIGRELQVSSCGTTNMATCHDLNVYLDLVNQLSIGI